jgi:hypothetical protein
MSELSEEDLLAIEERLLHTSPEPWTPFIEGRDHFSGDNFIKIGEVNGTLDMYVTLTGDDLIKRPASDSDLDFIAHARQDIPRLLAEVRRTRTKGSI